MLAVDSGRTFDCNRFRQAVDCVILDFVLQASLHLGWPSSQHACYWLTPCLTKFSLAQQLRPACLEPSLDWMTQKISGKLSSGWSKWVDRCGLPWWIVGAFPGCHLVLGDRAPNSPRVCSMLDKHLAGSVLFPGFVPHWDPVWAAGGDCASGSMVWPCVSHPPLSSHQTEGCIMAIVLSHLDDASSPQSLTVTCLSDNYHRNQLSYPPGSKGPCAGDWQAFNFASSHCCHAVPFLSLLRLCFSLLVFRCSMLTIQSLFTSWYFLTHVPVPVEIAGDSSPCLQGLLPRYHTSVHQESRRKRKPLSKHPWSLPFLSVFCSFFPLFPLGGTLTSFVRTITPLTLGIKTWNLCGLIRFRAEFILSPWKAKRERGKRRIWAVGFIMNLLFAQIDILKTNVEADHI